MKSAIAYIVLLLFFFSCKKDSGEITKSSYATKELKHEVILIVDDFSRHVEVLSKGNATSEVPLKNKAIYITYIVYNSNGDEVSRIDQDSTGATTRFINDRVSPEKFAGIQTFGCIKDSLETGSYTVVMIASMARHEINIKTITSEGYFFNPLEEAVFYYEGGLNSWSRAGDTFFKKFPITVGSQDFQQNITLSRIVGKAEINILDSKPGTTFKFLFLNENEGFKFSTEIPWGSTDDINNEQYLEETPGVSKLSYSKFLINTTTPVDVIIKVFENGTLTTSKTINDVTFHKNKRTILTGNIYSPKTTKTSFTVTVNDEFDKDSVEVAF